jgi:hypothetical protein
MYAQRGPAYSNMVSFGVAIPLQWDQKNRQDREVAAKVAMVEQAEAQREEMLRTHVAEVRNMVNEWENLKERRARYGRELLPLAVQRTEAVLTAYRGARSTLGEVLAARRSEIDVRLQALQLEAEQARLWAQLNFLIPIHSTARRARDESKNDRRCVTVAALIGTGGYAVYRLGMNRGMQMSASSASAPTSGTPQKAGDVDPGTGRKVLYWHDPMVPGQRFDKPGKSPFMDMQLVPVYEGGAGQEGTVAIDPRVRRTWEYAPRKFAAFP